MSKSNLELRKSDIQKARKSLTTLYNDLKNVDRWEHKIYKSIFEYLEVLSTRLFYYDNATDVAIKGKKEGRIKGMTITREKFKAYVGVRKSGITNMCDLQAVGNIAEMQYLVELTREECMEIMMNYGKYEEEYKDV